MLVIYLFYSYQVHLHFARCQFSLNHIFIKPYRALRAFTGTKIVLALQQQKPRSPYKLLSQRIPSVKSTTKSSGKGKGNQEDGEKKKCKKKNQGKRQLPLKFMQPFICIPHPKIMFIHISPPSIYVDLIRSLRL